MYKNVKVGDTLRITGDSGFCYPSDEVVTSLEPKYDESTGAKYNVIHTGTGAYSSLTGGAVKPPKAYYIDYVKVVV